MVCLETSCCASRFSAFLHVLLPGVWVDVIVHVSDPILHHFGWLSSRLARRRTRRVEHENVGPSDALARVVLGRRGRAVVGHGGPTIGGVLMEGEELFVLDNSKLLVREFTQLG